MIDIKEEMYGSVHSHAEDMFDTGNDLKSWVLGFVKRGAKKVALTGHGSMFAYEDLKGIVSSLKKDGQIPDDFEIIPGVEIYFNGLDKEENKQKSKHMVLIAKNYEGYKDLCRVISDASRNTKISKGGSEDNEYLTPLVTMENLRKNIRKGNVYATSACVGGVFGYDLGMEEYNLKKKYDKEIEKAGGNNFIEAIDADDEFIREYLRIKNDPSSKKPTKAEKTKALKLAGKGDNSLSLELEEREIRYKEKTDFLELNKTKYEACKKRLSSLKKKEEKIDEIKEAYNNYLNSASDRWNEAKEEYKELEEIFGKENFFFEIQNHTLDFEKTIFNNIIRLAYEVDNPNFIASNDVHIGDYKGSSTWENSVFKRKVERFKRFKNIEDDKGDETEYGIKSDNELKEALLEIIEDYRDENGNLHKKEEIIDTSIGNIKNLLKDCSVKFPEISVDGYNHYPKFCEDEKARLKEEVEKGIKRRFPDGLPEGYRERIDYELGIIENMGFSGYFLIVQDYLNYGRLLGYMRNEDEIFMAPTSIPALEKYIEEKHIPKIGMGIGPGRGSATGSLCAYLIGITELDPLNYGLLFERFLNPSRQTMPDIDSDFKDDIREKVYDYIKARYGDECVSKVATKSYTHGKGAVLLMQQYMYAEYEKEEKEKLEKELDILKKDTHNDPALEIALGKKEKEMTADLKKRLADKKAEYISTKNAVSKIFDKYLKDNKLSTANHPELGTVYLKDMLEDKEVSLTADQRIMIEKAVSVAGIPATLGMHACACLISGDPLKDVIPLAWNDKNQKMTTQCLYPQAEDLGLLKMDLLNIKNLSVITKVMQETGDTRLSDPAEVQKILAEKDIYEKIYSAGLTTGIFQVESDGMTKMMMDFKPKCFEDVILLVAAYRPGPIDFIPEIIATKRYMEDPEHNIKPKRSLDIDNEILQDILKPTYGVPIYQEQVMQIFQKLAGYSLADADNVRRFMSKKKEEPLKKEKPFFIHGDESRGIRGCVAAGLTEEEAELLFDKLVEFSKYAFNKSHAAAYAQVSVFTAYQKLHFPLQFYKHTLSNEIKDNAGKENPVAKYIMEMRGRGIDILPPKIGKSKSDFEIEGNNIRMGYGNIKGMSYKDYAGNIGSSISMFIYNNPDISMSTLTCFAKLGLFDKCYQIKESDVEKDRVGGSREECERWIRERAPMAVAIAEIYKKISACETRCKDLYDQMEELKDNAPNENDLYLSLRAEYSENSKELARLKELFLKEKEAFREVKDGDMAKGNCSEDPSDKKRAYRDYELQALGFPFSAEKEIMNLVKYKASSYNSFITKASESNKECYENIAVIIIKEDERRSKAGNVYYEYTFMDKERSIFKARSFEKLDRDMGALGFKYTPANEKYGASISVDKNFKDLEKDTMTGGVLKQTQDGRYIPDINIYKAPETKDIESEELTK